MKFMKRNFAVTALMISTKDVFEYEGRKCFVKAITNTSIVATAMPDENHSQHANKTFKHDKLLGTVFMRGDLKLKLSAIADVKQLRFWDIKEGDLISQTLTVIGRKYQYILVTRKGSDVVEQLTNRMINEKHHYVERDGELYIINPSSGPKPKVNAKPLTNDVANRVAEAMSKYNIDATAVQEIHNAIFQCSKTETTSIASMPVTA